MFREKMKFVTVQLFLLLSILFVYAIRPSNNRINLARMLESQWISKRPKYYEGHKRENTTEHKTEIMELLETLF